MTETSNSLKHYSFNPDPFAAHQKVIKLVGLEKVVLDVGCATGELAERMKRSGCSVYGIEIDLEAAARAREHCADVFVMDLDETVALPVSPDFFDVMVFADVLEHLTDPFRVLVSFHPYLEDTGYIVYSIPNIAHWTVRFQLLRGHFDYTDKGILDVTHLRFFTHKTARRLITSAGYCITDEDFTLGPFIPMRFFQGHYLQALTRKFPSLLALQFVIVAVKHSDMAYSHSINSAGR